MAGETEYMPENIAEQLPVEQQREPIDPFFIEGQSAVADFGHFLWRLSEGMTKEVEEEHRNRERAGGYRHGHPVHPDQIIRSVSLGLPLHEQPIGAWLKVTPHEIIRQHAGKDSEYMLIEIFAENPDGKDTEARPTPEITITYKDLHEGAHGYTSSWTRRSASGIRNIKRVMHFSIGNREVEFEQFDHEIILNDGSVVPADVWEMTEATIGGVPMQYMDELADTLLPVMNLLEGTLRRYA